MPTLEEQVARFSENEPRLDRIVNGNDTEDVGLGDGRQLPSVAKLFAGIEDKFEGLGATKADINDAQAFFVAPSSFKPSTVLNFADNRVSGTVPNELALVGGATAVLDDTGALVVDAPYNAAPTAKAALVPGVVFAEGRLRWKIVNGGGAMLKFVDKLLKGRAIWANDGALYYGVIDRAGTVLESYGQAALAGAPGDDVWIELITGPYSAGQSFIVRTWKDGTAYPAPAINGQYNATNRTNEGRLSLHSFAGTQAKTKAIIVDDGAKGTALAQATAKYNGLWINRFSGGNNVMNTIRTGQSWSSRVTGVTAVRTVFVRALDDNKPPCVTAIVNGVRTGQIVDLAAANGGTGVIDFPTGLDPEKVYDIEWIIVGMNQGNNKFGLGGGVSIVRTQPIPATGIVAPLDDNRRSIRFNGDSITEGVRLRAVTQDDSPQSYGGDLTYGQIAARSINRRPVISAFGGTGLVVGNLSNQPSAIDNGQEPNSGPIYPYGHINNYMYDRRIDTPAQNYEAVVYNLGTNDFSRGVPAQTFEDAYVRELQDALIKNPNARRIYVLRPFNGNYAANVQNAVNRLNSDKISYRDTTNWGVTYSSDGLHPDANGQASAGQQLGLILAAELL